MTEQKIGDRLVYLFSCLITSIGLHVLIIRKSTEVGDLLLEPTTYFFNLIQWDMEESPFIFLTVSGLFYGFVIWVVSSIVFTLKDKKKNLHSNQNLKAE